MLKQYQLSHLFMQPMSIVSTFGALIFWYTVYNCIPFRRLIFLTQLFIVPFQTLPFHPFFFKFSPRLRPICSINRIMLPYYHFRQFHRPRLMYWLLHPLLFLSNIPLVYCSVLIISYAALTPAFDATVLRSTSDMAAGGLHRLKISLAMPSQHAVDFHLTKRWSAAGIIDQ